jgi:hypothetical protein
MVLPFVTGGSHLSGSLRLNGFAAHRLAYMLDSLVRVSRRVGWRAQYASVPSAQVPHEEARLVNEARASSLGHRNGIGGQQSPLLSRRDGPR